MLIEPVGKYQSPDFPTKDIVLRNPNLLLKLPNRWKGNVTLGIALSSLLMMTFSGCGKENTAAYNDTNETVSVDPSSSPSPTETISVNPTDVDFSNPVTCLLTPEPTQDSTVLPTEKPTATPNEKDTDNSTAKPTVKPAEKPTLKPTTKPTLEPTLKPTPIPTPIKRLSENYSVPPLFKHGDGMGGFGCMAVAPPSFLSEEEAFQVIKEEAAKAGISFSRGGLELDDVKIPITDINDIDGIHNDKYLDRESPVHTKSGELKLEGYNSNLKLGFVFVSSDDTKRWSSSDYGTGNVGTASVTTYNMFSTADVLQEGLIDKKEDVTVGVFYDPQASITQGDLKKPGYSEIPELRTERSIELLREQVKDFIKWLKAEGII